MAEKIEKISDTELKITETTKIERIVYKGELEEQKVIKEAELAKINEYLDKFK